MSHSDSPVVLEARGFSKNYGKLRAVRDVSFSVGKGEIFGLIGPDGGGKTSLMRSLVSLLHVEEGELFYKGESIAANPEAVRRNIGYMPQRFSLYQDLTVSENLKFFSRLFNVGKEESRKKIEELYSFSGLKPFVKRRAGALSGGMKQKLALSCMLVHSPDVIVLDEPTFGVDPLSRSEFWQILTRLKEEGTTILVSTAYMDEAPLCDRIGLMFEGKILVIDRPENLKNHFSQALFAVRSDNPHLIHDSLGASGLCGECNLFGEGVHFTLNKGHSREDVLQFLTSREESFDSIEPIEWGIEDLFLKLMKGEEHERIGQ